MIEGAVKQRPERPVVVLCTGSPNGFVRRVFEAGADDLIMLPADRDRGERRVLFALEKAVARRSRAQRSDRRRAGADDLRARAEGRHRQDADLVQPRRSAWRRPGTRVAVVDLDLQFGDVGLALGLTPERTIYDLAKSAGSLDAEKLEALPRHAHESGCAS